jgi:hypothetical protein
MTLARLGWSGGDSGVFIGPWRAHGLILQVATDARGRAAVWTG